MKCALRWRAESTSATTCASRRPSAGSTLLASSTSTSGSRKRSCSQATSCSAPSPCKSRRLVPVLRHAVPSDLRLPAAGVARISQERAPATLISSPARNLSVRAGRAHARKRSTHAKPVRDHQARDARRAEAHHRKCLGRLQQRREAQLHSERLSPSRLTRAEGLSRRRAHE